MTKSFGPFPLIIIILTIGFMALGLFENFRQPDYFRVHSPDMDRDWGAAQALLDGDWFGDPNAAGEVKWYNPLYPALAAALSWAFSLPVGKSFLVMAPVINGLSIPLFYLLVARHYGQKIALIASFLFLSVNGLDGFYILTPSFSRIPVPSSAGLTALLAGALLMPGKPGFRNGLIAGGILGLIFLVHPAPFLILGLANFLEIAAGRFTKRAKAAWLCGGVAMAVLVALPFLGPLLFRYHLVILHTDPADWWPAFIGFRRSLTGFILDFLGISGIYIWMRSKADPGTALYFLTISCCLLFIVFDIFHLSRVWFHTPYLMPVPIHHFWYYFRLTLPIVFAPIIMALVQHWRALRPGLALALLLFPVFLLPLHRDFRALFLHNENGRFGERLQQIRETYLWILDRTRPKDVFLTDQLTSVPVMAAGRKMVNLNDPIFASPYLDYHAREALRQKLVAAVQNLGVCRALIDSNVQYVLLRKAQAIPPSLAEPLYFRDWVLYRVADCGGSANQG